MLRPGRRAYLRCGAGGSGQVRRGPAGTPLLEAAELSAEREALAGTRNPPAFLPWVRAPETGDRKSLSVQGAGWAPGRDVKRGSQNPHVRLHFRSSGAGAAGAPPSGSPVGSTAREVRQCSP